MFRIFLLDFYFLPQTDECPLEGISFDFVIKLFDKKIIFLEFKLN
jgi:hypothetical protein